MKKFTCFTLSLLILLASVVGLAACSSSEGTPESAEDSIRAYADPATETTLQGLSEDDLAKYTKYANDEFKAALTSEILSATSTQINDQLGTFQSIEFLSTEEQEGYTIVHYRATYSKGDVGVRMVFDKDHKVAGQWFE
jgi:hypothetical protein